MVDSTAAPTTETTETTEAEVPAAPVTAAPDADLVSEDVLLVEDVSIDGMCGVY